MSLPKKHIEVFPLLNNNRTNPFNSSCHSGYFRILVGQIPPSLCTGLNCENKKHW